MLKVSLVMMMIIIIIIVIRVLVLLRKQILRMEILFSIILGFVTIITAPDTIISSKYEYEHLLDI